MKPGVEDLATAIGEQLKTATTHFKMYWRGRPGDRFYIEATLRELLAYEACSLWAYPSENIRPGVSQEFMILVCPLGIEDL